MTTEVVDRGDPPVEVETGVAERAYVFARLFGSVQVKDMTKSSIGDLSRDFVT